MDADSVLEKIKTKVSSKTGNSPKCHTVTFLSVTDTYVHTVHVHHENRSLIQSLAH